MLTILCPPLASDARYKIGNAAHPSAGRGTVPLLGSNDQVFFAISIEGRTFTNIGPRSASGPGEMMRPVCWVH